MRHLRHALLCLALVGGLLALTPTTAGAGDNTPIWVVIDELEGKIDTLVIEIENQGDECDGDGPTTVEVLSEDDAVLATLELSGQNSGTVTIPDDLAETIFALRVTCEVEGFDQTALVVQEDGQEPEVAEFDYAGLDVTKAVEGDVPDGTEFVIRVDCLSEGEIPGGEIPGDELPQIEGQGLAGTDGPIDLTFPADGGTNRVWFSFGHLCEVTETEDGGAESTTIVDEDCSEEGVPDELDFGDGPGEVVIFAPVQCDATVTNVFAEATTTTSTPTTTTTRPSGAVEAEAATPTVASPTFTG